MKLKITFFVRSDFIKTNLCAFFKNKCLALNYQYFFTGF